MRELDCGGRVVREGQGHHNPKQTASLSDMCRPFMHVPPPRCCTAGRQQRPEHEQRSSAHGAHARGDRERGDRLLAGAHPVTLRWGRVTQVGAGHS